MTSFVHLDLARQRVLQTLGDNKCSTPTIRSSSSKRWGGILSATSEALIYSFGRDVLEFNTASLDALTSNCLKRLICCLLYHSALSSSGDFLQVTIRIECSEERTALPLTFRGSLGLHMDELAWDNNAFVMVLTIGFNDSSEDYGEMETFLGFLNDIWECIDGIRWRVNQWENSICCTSQNLGHIQSLSKDFSFEDAKRGLCSLWMHCESSFPSSAHRLLIVHEWRITFKSSCPERDRKITHRIIFHLRYHAHKVVSRYSQAAHNTQSAPF